MLNKIFLNFKIIKNKIINFLNNCFTEDHLIIFDKKVIYFISFVILLFFSLTLFKIHGSSITIWNEILPNQEQNYKEGVIWGKPKSVRSDEWVVNTPFVMSQALITPSYPLSNENIGSENVPLLTNLPVRHISDLFRPQHWGYFLAGLERGFAWFWNFKFLVVILGFFLLFMILTKNNFWLSVFGSLWIYASSFTQWWYSSAAEIMGIAALIFVGLAYLLFSQKKINILLGGFFVTIFGINFVLFLYPPYQVQLAYLVLFLIIGYSLNSHTFKKIKDLWQLRVVTIFAGLTISLPVLYKFYLDSMNTINIIMNTTYPGRRQSIGGGVTLSRYFSGFYSSVLRDGHVPKSFLNASEASNFIVFYPLIIIAIFINFMKSKKNNFVILMMILYIIIISFWMKFGFPLSISKITLLSFAPSERCYLGFGLASIIASVIYLSGNDVLIKTRKQLIFYASFIAILLGSYGLYLNEQTGFYFKWYLIAIITTIFTGASIFFLSKKRFLFCGVILFMTIGPAIFINPISIGLKPILGKKILETINYEKIQNNKSKWAVYGNRLLPNFFQATGAKVLDGVKYTPIRDELNVFDPNGKYEKVYNRYAHTYLDQRPGMENNIEFELVYPDLYKIYIDPCNPVLKKLGVTNLAFDKKPGDEILKCAVPLNSEPINKTWLYRYN